ncbi:MAG: hemolysin family protein [Syntrophales bacterium]|jgi:CBS domain containing-hemolysin-like protein|nr:hemolysin family protein [Syntrophales bacterium]HQN26432.1 hemolysin family protein [Syntrophales bacterium]HQP28888.1 hemolysin family protein [Syntrophales bacterium]
MTLAATVALILFCLALEALFSGGEIALLSSEPHRIRHRAEQGQWSARLAMKLIEKPEWFLATTLTGTNLAVVTSSTLATALFISLYGVARGEAVSGLVMIPTLLIMIVARSVFYQYAERLAVRLAPFIWAASFILLPAVYLISRLSRGTIRLSSGRREAAASYITRDGLKSLLGEGAAAGDMESRERDMVRRVIDFSDVTVEAVMVPISNTTVLPHTASVSDALAMAEERRNLRIPVYQDQVFNIVGILNTFDLLGALGAGGQRPERSEDPIAPLVRPVALYVPEKKQAKEVLIELRVRGERMAVVVDEYGGAVGIVTIEDILEEIVGEIEDEYDREEALYRADGPGNWLFSARIGLEKFREVVPVDIPAGDYETLGGFLLFRFGRIPRRRDTLAWGGARFVVEDAGPKVIREVRVLMPVEAGPHGEQAR